MEETLQRLFNILPGYKGYAAKEHRRDADKILRTQLSGQFRDEQHLLTRIAQQLVATPGGLKHVERIEKVSQGLERFIVKLQTAPRGYAGWFSEITIDEVTLDQLYQYDLKLAESVTQLHERITHLETQVNEQGDIAEAVATLQTFMDDLNRQLDARDQFTAEGKAPDAPPL
ncbi:MAG: hypothetical protein HC893_15575 [Chloroflexaceae bacterium]|nr:hypothetical protein [Chloroflexaceae bacterium]NJL35004.1 hypothetical protein [Chloroflexaceae bacterium]NJO06945.1 hypothetical protein [Chloroflexaceae bacterium]